jgi:hypothetical protein
MDIRNNGWVATLLALSALSCGDAAPPPPEAAVAIALYPSNTASSSYGCPSHSLGWTSDGTEPTATSPGGLLVDGQDGADVECKVKENGTFVVSATVENDGIEFGLTGTVNADGTGTASVSFYDPTLIGGMRDSNCTISLGTDTDNYAVESGALWAAVSCNKLTTPDYQGIWCAGNAVVVFKSCDE